MTFSFFQAPWCDIYSPLMATGPMCQWTSHWLSWNLGFCSFCAFAQATPPGKTQCPPSKSPPTLWDSGWSFPGLLSLLGTLTACICDTHVTLMWPHAVSICVPVSAPLHKFTDWQGVGEREGSCSDLAASQHGLGLCQTRKRCPVSAQ